MSIKRDTVWAGVDTVVTQGLALLFRLALAKLLSPEAFGVISLALIIVSVLQVINDFGFTASLIQKDDKLITDVMVNSVFAASVVISVCLFAINALVAAPLAALFFNVPDIGPLTIVIGISLLFTPVSSVCRALLFRNLKFRAVTIARIISTLISLVLGVAVLLIWRSVWAFAVQVIISQFFLSLLLYLNCNWRPLFQFDGASFRGVFGYSSFVFINDLSVSLSRNLDVMVIAHILGPGEAGLYAFAFFLTDTVRVNLMSILNRVMFVHYSKAQNDLAALRVNYLKTLQWNCRAIFPLMVCLACFGPILIEQVMGPSWHGMAPTLRWLSLAVMVHAAGGTSSTLYKAIGRPGLDMSIFLATTAVFLLPALTMGAMTGEITGVAVGIFIAKGLTVLTRQIILDRLIGSTFWAVLRQLQINLLRQAPIVLVWLAGVLAWPEGGWARDLLLGTLCLGVAGFHLLFIEFKLLKLGMKTDDGAETNGGYRNDSRSKSRESL